MCVDVCCCFSKSFSLQEDKTIGQHTHETFLVVQWLRICLASRGHRVDFQLGNKDPTCHGAAKPMCGNF